MMTVEYFIAMGMCYLTYRWGFSLGRKTGVVDATTIMTAWVEKKAGKLQLNAWLQEDEDESILPRD